MKVKGILSTFLRLMRNAIIALIINMAIALVIYYFFKFKEMHQYGSVLCGIGFLYLLPLAGSINSDAALKDSVAFSAARSVSSVSSDEIRALEKEDLSRDIATSIKLLVYGGLTMLVSSLFFLDYLNL